MDNKKGFCHCPHCGKGVNYFYVWSIKSKGEYLCKKCGNCSNIRMRPVLPAIGWGAVAIIAIMVAIFILTSCEFIWMIPLMLVPFFIFTAISPFFIKLTSIEGDEKKKMDKMLPKKKLYQQYVQPSKKKAAR